MASHEDFTNLISKMKPSGHRYITPFRGSDLRLAVNIKNGEYVEILRKANIFAITKIKMGNKWIYWMDCDSYVENCSKWYAIVFIDSNGVIWPLKYKNKMQFNENERPIKLLNNYFEGFCTNQNKNRMIKRRLKYGKLKSRWGYELMSDRNIKEWKKIEDKISDMPIITDRDLGRLKHMHPRVMEAYLAIK